MGAGKGITKKESNRLKILEYLGNPEHDFVSRDVLSTEVLGYSHAGTVYKYFTAQELAEIEREAFEIRKHLTTRQRNDVYKALYTSAINGDTKAATEFLNRTEGKVPDKVDMNNRLSGSDGKPLRVLVDFSGPAKDEQE